MITGNIDDLAEWIKRWADEQFPNRTDSSMWLKVYEEVAETIRSGGEPWEVADLFILLLDYAKRKNINIQEAIEAKMAVNKRRTWVVDNGVMRHEEKK